MTGKLALYAVGQPGITLAESAEGEWPKGVITEIGRAPREGEWPTGHITRIAKLPYENPDFVFGSVIDAEANLHRKLPPVHMLTRSPTTGAPQLVVHVEHGPTIAHKDLGFLEPITSQGFDVFIGILPTGKGFR